MRAHSSPGRAAMAGLTALSLVFSEMVPMLSAQTAQAPPVAPQPPAAADQPVDKGWPRNYDMPGGGSVVIYQPQVASWERQKHMVAFAAVAYTSAGAQKPDLGSIKLESDTSVSLEERLVRFPTIDLTESNFPKLSREQVGTVTAFLRDSIPDQERVIALDRVMAAIDTSAILPKDASGIKADPPKIFYSSSPAILVNLDGEPIWSPIKENDLRFAVNTNWDLFEHGPSKTFYLRNEDAWLKATDVDGPWTPAGKLPESFSKLPNEENWKEVKAALPGKKLDEKKTPKVFVTFEPAELILVQGPPKYELVAGTSLRWVSNTESDVFGMGKVGAMTLYYLVAGRWFSAPDFTGPWTFATTSLPEDFKKIPLEHPRSRVLASVPGTRQAAEAVLLAQIPETARVNIKTLKAPPVSYQGEPKFEPEPGTEVQSAVNTDKDIFKFGDKYYMCYNGVWFSAKGPNGPWEVETNIPKELYQIPSSSSHHHVTYVTVEDDDSSDEWATFAVVAGYTGLMIAWGCAVWGSGWYYPPYIGYGGFYPVYYPRYPTYGYSAWYNPWTGGYGRGVRAYGPYGGAGAGARYNPTTGTYARGASAWGPYGSRGVAEAWNPRTGTYGRTRQGSNVYGSWGTTSVQRGDDWAQTSRVTNRATGTTTRVTRTDEGAMASRRGAGGGTVAAGSGGDVYAGRDGNVYRKQDGNWQKNDSGSWNNVDPPQRSGERPTPSTSTTRSTTRSMDSSTYGQLQRDSASRTDGTQRTRDYSSYQSGSSGSRSTGSYRPSGGGARGGGRRR
jgi:hypothetical protein